MHLRHHITELAGPLTIITVAGSAFTALAASVAEGNDLARLDPSMAGEVIEHRTSALTTAAHLLSFVGSEVVLAVLTLGLVIVLLERRGPRSALLAGAAMAISAGLTVVVKTAFGRARPGASDRLGQFDSTYSFPSGHTLNSAVFLGLVCMLLISSWSQRRARLVAYAAASALAIGIGASRIYLGYHWTTDVLASWTIATMLLTVMHIVSRCLTPPAQQSGGVQVEQATVDS